MNEPITKVIYKECEHGTNQEFSVFFKPDPSKETFEVAMTYRIISVNRHTGEVKFALDLDCSIDDQISKTKV